MGHRNKTVGNHCDRCCRISRSTGSSRQLSPGPSRVRAINNKVPTEQHNTDDDIDKNEILNTIVVSLAARYAIDAGQHVAITITAPHGKVR